MFNLLKKKNKCHFGINFLIQHCYFNMDCKIMKYLEIEEIIKNTVSSTTTDENGWANLAKVGILLRRKGVKYLKLSKLLRNFTHIIELKSNESTSPAITYIRLKKLE